MSKKFNFAICLLSLQFAVIIAPAVHSGIITNTGTNQNYVENFEPPGSPGQDSACCPAGSAPVDSWYNVATAGSGGSAVVSATATTGSTQAFTVTDSVGATGQFTGQLQNTGIGVNLCTGGQENTYSMGIPASTAIGQNVEYRHTGAAPTTTVTPANTFGQIITRTGVGTVAYQWYVHGNAGAIQTAPTTPIALSTATRHTIRTFGVACTSPYSVSFSLDSGVPVTISFADTIAGPINRVGIASVGTVGVGASFFLDDYSWPNGPLPAPTITSITPSVGYSKFNVTIHGMGFIANATTVTFGGYLARVHASNSVSIQVVTPPHPPGPVDVKLTNPDGQTFTATSAFTYYAPTFSGACPTIPNMVAPTTTAYTEDFGAFQPGDIPSRCWYTYQSAGLSNEGITNSTFFPNGFTSVNPVSGVPSSVVAGDTNSATLSDTSATNSHLDFNIYNSWNGCNALATHQIGMAFNLGSSTNTKFKFGLLDEAALSDTQPFGDTNSKGKTYIEFSPSSTSTLYLKGSSSSSTSASIPGTILLNTWYFAYIQFNCRVLDDAPGGVATRLYTAAAVLSSASGSLLGQNSVTLSNSFIPTGRMSAVTAGFEGTGGTPTGQANIDHLEITYLPGADYTKALTQPLRGFAASPDANILAMRQIIPTNPHGGDAITAMTGTFVQTGFDNSRLYSQTLYGLAATNTEISYYGDANDAGNGCPGACPTLEIADRTLNPKTGGHSQDFPFLTDSTPSGVAEIGAIIEMPIDESRVVNEANGCGAFGSGVGGGSSPPPPGTTGEGVGEPSTFVGFAFSELGNGNVGVYVEDQRGCGSQDKSDMFLDSFGPAGTTVEQMCFFTSPGGISYMGAAYPGIGVAFWEIQTSIDTGSRVSSGGDTHTHVSVTAHRHDVIDARLANAVSISCAADRAVVGTNDGHFLVLKAIVDASGIGIGQVLSDLTLANAHLRGVGLSQSGLYAAYWAGNIATGSVIVIYNLVNLSRPAIVYLNFAFAINDASPPTVNQIFIDRINQFIYEITPNKLLRYPIALFTGGFRADPHPEVSYGDPFGDLDGDGLCNKCDPFPNDADCNHNGIPDGQEANFTCGGTTYNTTALKNCASDDTTTLCKQVHQQSVCSEDPTSVQCTGAKQDVINSTPVGGIGGGRPFFPGIDLDLAAAQMGTSVDVVCGLLMAVLFVIMALVVGAVGAYFAGGIGFVVGAFMGALGAFVMGLFFACIPLWFAILLFALCLLALFLIARMVF